MIRDGPGLSAPSTNQARIELQAHQEHIECQTQMGNHIEDGHRGVGDSDAANDYVLGEERALEMRQQQPEERGTQKDTSNHLTDDLRLAEPSANHPNETTGGKNDR